MAFSDYGAFVYKDGHRRRDREDVSIYQEGCDIPAPARIFAHIAQQIQEGATTSAAADCYHAVLGDGPVRVGCYKTGVGIVFSLDEESGEAKEIFREDIARQVLGDDFIEYVDMDYPSDDNAEERHEYFHCNDDYYAQFEAPYRFEIDVDGAHIEFYALDPKDDPDVTVYPRYRARLVEADGSVWDGFYDSLYGAGHTDAGKGADPYAFDEIEVGCAPEVRSLDLRAKECEIFENDPLIEGDMAALYTATGEVVYRGEKLCFYDAEGGVHEEGANTLRSITSSFINTRDYIAILNEGIALAKRGIDAVGIDCGGWGGEHEGLDDFDKIDSDFHDDIIDFERSASTFNDFRAFHERVRERAKETLTKDCGPVVDVEAEERKDRAETPCLVGDVEGKVGEDK